jgi:hypothetical protein
MRQKSVPEKEPATQVVKNIRRAMRRYFSAEDKIRIVLEGLRGEDSIAELCRREGATMSQKSSLPQPTQSVSRVLTADISPTSNPQFLGRSSGVVAQASCLALINRILMVNGRRGLCAH